MRTYVTVLLAAGGLALALGISSPADARIGGWHGGGWNGGWHGGGWRSARWHGGWHGSGWGGARWGWGPRWRGWGWGTGVGIAVGSRRCWSNRFGWVPCRWAYR